MQVTKEYLTNRLGQLEQLKAQAVATANASDGAIQITKELLTYLDTPEPAVPEDATEVPTNGS